MHDDSAARRIRDGSIWDEFCDTLKRAGEVVRRERSPQDLLDQAEGYRYLSRLVRLALEKFVEHDDPAAPRFYRLSHDTGKIGCDNPDSYYQNAAISGQYEYRLWGHRGTVSYLGFGTYYGHYGSAARSGCSGYLEASELQVEPDGRFEIVLSCRPQPGKNWLRMEPDTSMLIVRQNVLDWQTERLAELHIERLDAAGPPAPLGAAQLVDGLTNAARFAAGTAALFADWVEGFAVHPNELRALDPKMTGGAHGDPNIQYYMGYWELGPDQALIIDVTPPACEYWNVQINNYWMESLDYRYHTIDYNKHTATYRPDGSVRLVVAHRDPGVPNWLDTAGHARGTMGLRWIKATSHPQPATRVVKVADLERA
jgi:hypothetical protein